MIKENPEEGPTCAASGRWFRDPALPIHRTEITRFPHAVLEVKLSLNEGETAPPWVQVGGSYGFGFNLLCFLIFSRGGGAWFWGPFWFAFHSLDPVLLPLLQLIPFFVCFLFCRCWPSVTIGLERARSQLGASWACVRSCCRAHSCHYLLELRASAI